MRNTKIIQLLMLCKTKTDVHYRKLARERSMVGCEGHEF